MNKKYTAKYFEMMLDYLRDDMRGVWLMPHDRMRNEKNSTGLKRRSMRSRGLTLVELMMVVLILSVMASIALPLGKIQFVRYKENRLERYLEDFRYGIDEFNKHNTTSVAISGDGIDNDGDGNIDEEIYDWKDNDGDGSVDEDVAATGYPLSLYSMIQNHWLRKVPVEPFDNKWQYRPSFGGPSNWKDFVDYGGSFEAQAGDDIYDIRSDGSRINTAIDGSQYSDW